MVFYYLKASQSCMSVPFLARMRAVCCPMPELAPVTITVLPSMSVVSASYFLPPK